MVMGTTGVSDLRTISSELKYYPQISPESTITSPNNFFSEDLQSILLTPPAPTPLQYNGFIDPILIPFPSKSIFQTPIIDPTPPVQNASPNSTITTQQDSTDDSEIFSDIVLSYINSMLMEEDIDLKYEQYPENPALLAAEKPFLEILEEKSLPNLPSPDQSPLYSNDTTNSPDDSSINPSINSNDTVALDNSITLPYDPIEFLDLQNKPVLINYSSQSSFSSTNSNQNKNINNSLEGLDQLGESVWQFNKGVEEAAKFLPDEGKLVIDLESNRFSLPIKLREEREETKAMVPPEVNSEKDEIPVHRGKKHLYFEDGLDTEETRSNKQSAANPEEFVREMFDKVLLCNGETCSKGVKELREALQHEAAKLSQSNHHSKNSHGKGRGKRQLKKEVVDTRTLLSHCAQAVATDDRRSASELLKQLRQHASKKGDANQRLAHYFADGLEARLGGTGSQIYQAFTMKRIASTDVLKAYQLYLAASPFKKISHFFSNQTILDATERATRVHIIDFGIYYGFQWPCLIQRLSNRPGGPPKLRITGIDSPQPGFRPAQQIEETGNRLADYAHTFNVPFEYKAIAARWETIKIEDLDIRKDELLVVNSLFRFKTLMDESVMVDSPRDTVLKTIRKMNPDVFIHGVVNGSYNAPFFVTRFREALFHFSALFDMLETNVPREDEPRQLLERAVFGREAINVISCEGMERVERPETYKQWQVRNLRAGFKQLPINGDIMKKAREKVKSCYHKDFIIDEDNRWLLLGWKGRILFSLSTWRPSHRPS